MKYFSQKIVQSKPFEIIVVFLILLTAVLIGYESFPERMTPQLQNHFDTAYAVIKYCFVIEVFLKMSAQDKPWHYFKRKWNYFDVGLIVISFIPSASNIALVGRILRVLRVRRLILIIPELRLITETLIRSIPSMFHVLLLMGLLFFIYAVVGFNLFHEHDPEHWQNLSYAILSLFHVVTLDDWTDIMYKTMELSPYYGFYFVSFILLGTYIVANLFIAVVLNNFEKSKLTGRAAQQQTVEIDGLTIDALRTNIAIAQKYLTALEKQQQASKQ